MAQILDGKLVAQKTRERLRRELSGQEEKEGQRYVRPQIIP